jgi:dolichol-phosphate mannosyltransferase
MKLSVVLPVYNEENTIAEILDRVLRVPIDKEIVVVDDGSTDRTREILERRAGPDGFLLVRHDRNRGKGAAIRTALEKVAGEVIVIQDADLEYNPADLVSLLRPILDGKASVVYGSRVLGNPGFYSMGVVRYHRQGYFRNPVLTIGFYYGGRMVTWLTNLLYGSALTDQPTCYKMFRREVLRDIRLECEGFEFCSEITAKLLLAGHAIEEVPISFTPRRVTEGKKLKWKDGFKAILTLFRFRFPAGSAH